MLALFFWLAQSTPPPISINWQTDLFSAGILILIGLNIWDKLKRKPSLEECFSTKNEAVAAIAVSKEADDRMERELKSLDERTRTEIGALDKRTQESIRAMNDIGEKRAQSNRDLIQEKISALEKSIGEKISENRENNTGSFSKIEGRLDSFQVSMQGLSNDVMHQIGRLEGQMEGRKAAV